MKLSISNLFQGCYSLGNKSCNFIYFLIPKNIVNSKPINVLMTKTNFDTKI